VLRRIIEPKRDEIIKDLRKFHNEELHNVRLKRINALKIFSRATSGINVEQKPAYQIFPMSPSSGSTW
jgi:hypothetical protein